MARGSPSGSRLSAGRGLSSIGTLSSARVNALPRTRPSGPAVRDRRSSSIGRDDLDTPYVFAMLAAISYDRYLILERCFAVTLRIVPQVIHQARHSDSRPGSGHRRSGSRRVENTRAQPAHVTARPAAVKAGIARLATIQEGGATVSAAPATANDASPAPAWPRTPPPPPGARRAAVATGRLMAALDVDFTPPRAGASLPSHTPEGRAAPAAADRPCSS